MLYVEAKFQCDRPDKATTKFLQYFKKYIFIKFDYLYFFLKERNIINLKYFKKLFEEDEYKFKFLDHYNMNNIIYKYENKIIFYFL